MRGRIEAPEQNLRAKAAVPVVSGGFRFSSAQQLRKRTMRNNHISRPEERQFITKEFAATLAGKHPAPYFRLHDPVQKRLDVAQ